MENKKKILVVIPVYNRPEEIDELLDSMTRQDTKPDWEVVVVEDGSQVTSEQVCGKYADRLDIKYLSKPNSGPVLRAISVWNALRAIISLFWIRIACYRSGIFPPLIELSIRKSSWSFRRA